MEFAFRNVDEVTVPPYGIMVPDGPSQIDEAAELPQAALDLIPANELNMRRLTAWSDDPDEEDDDKKSMMYQPFYFVNGPSEVRPLDSGVCTVGGIQLALYRTDSTPLYPGAMVGPIKDKWELYHGMPGFTVVKILGSYPMKVEGSEGDSGVLKLILVSPGPLIIRGIIQLASPAFRVIDNDADNQGRGVFTPISCLSAKEAYSYKNQRGDEPDFATANFAASYGVEFWLDFAAEAGEGYSFTGDETGDGEAYFFLECNRYKVLGPCTNI